MTTRTPQDYALEHAEYMAAGAERLLDAANDYGFAVDVDMTDKAISEASEILTEARAGMRILIYEFRKRRDRALTSAAQPYDPGPQAATLEEAVADVGKWLNERPNRPLDLRSVAMLVAAVQQPREPLTNAAIAMHKALVRMTAIYESEQDHESPASLRPGWLKEALSLGYAYGYDQEMSANKEQT